MNNSLKAMQALRGLYLKRGSEHPPGGGTTKSRRRAMAAAPTACVACPTK
jgi:hypothetical protein